MSRKAFALLLGLSAFAASGANAASFIYAGALSGANESPATPSLGTGFTTVTYDDVAHTLHVVESFSGLLGNTTASHIHVREDPSLPNGGVATTTPTFAGFPLGVTSGSYDSILDLTQASSYNPAFVTLHGGIAGAESALAASLADGRSYLNIHTNLFPSGELRANLTAVPEPAAWALLLVGFGAVGSALRKARGRSLVPV